MTDDKRPHRESSWPRYLHSGQPTLAWNSYSYGQGQSSAEASIGFVALDTGELAYSTVVNSLLGSVW